MCWEQLTKDDELVETRATDVLREEDLERPEFRAEPPEEPAEREREGDLVSA
jgi:hypothetical protein